MDELFKDLVERTIYYEQFEQIERRWELTHSIKIWKP